MSLIINIFAFFLLILGPANNEADKKEFYLLVSSADKSKVTTYLARLEKSHLKEKEAYRGTLLMRIAGLSKSPKEKLSSFKEGALKLDSVIIQNKSNGEYRFLRLIIQENAPAILGYKKQIEEDHKILKSSFNTLDPIVQDAVIDYCKNSKVLRKEDFQK